MKLPRASDMRRAIADMLQARKGGVLATYDAALGHLYTFKYLPEESRAHIYKSSSDDDPEMVKNLQELLCTSLGLGPKDDGKSLMINLLTALLFVELGRDQVVHAAVLGEVIGHMSPKVNGPSF